MSSKVAEAVRYLKRRAKRAQDGRLLLQLKTETTTVRSHECVVHGYVTVSHTDNACASKEDTCLKAALDDGVVWWYF